MLRSTWTLFCRRALCLLLLFLAYSATVEAQGDEGVCYELLELADSRLTGLLNEQDQGRMNRCPHDLVDLDCTDPEKLQYRTMDGSCNNLAHPRWGKSLEPQKRLLPAQLEDGNLPRTRAKSGNALPMARVISLAISPAVDAFAEVSNMVMAWGQFIDHDFTGTPVTRNGSTKIICCGDIAEDLKLENGGPCFPIPLPPGDPLGKDCMQFVRSLPYSFPNGTHQVPREQVNILTSFLDASAVYGNTQTVLDSLRGKRGTLAVTENGMLPEDPSSTCKKEKEGDFCMLAGDHRVNVFVGLGALHTIFVREHNRIVNIFRSLNPNWDDDTLFQETRRIMSAQFQHVTYVEWLPLVLDDVTMMNYELTEGNFRYDPGVDPTVTNVFSTASFRFGHSQVKQAVKIGAEILQLQDTLMRPRFTLNSMADIIRGIVFEPTDVVDNSFVPGLTDHMFETNNTTKNGLDLLAVNIQRGRDHGLPPFNEWREFCNLPRITDFNSPEMLHDLSSVYEDPDDVDVFVGMMCEVHVPGSLVGPTLTCLLGDQFRDMKFGDRFFYETPEKREGFTEDQLKEIKKVTLARILCDNVPDLDEIQMNVFKLVDPSSNPVELCERFPSMDLHKWKSSGFGTGVDQSMVIGFVIGLFALGMYVVSLGAYLLIRRKRKQQTEEQEQKVKSSKLDPHYPAGPFQEERIRPWDPKFYSDPLVSAHTATTVAHSYLKVKGFDGGPVLILPHDTDTPWLESMHVYY